MLFYVDLPLSSRGSSTFRMGYASAMAWVLFGITMVCTVAIMKGSRRWVHYQGGVPMSTIGQLDEAETAIVLLRPG